jgi:hypothetical protein
VQRNSGRPDRVGKTHNAGGLRYLGISLSEWSGTSIFCGIDYLWIALNRRKQAVHDVVARTALVRAPERSGSGAWVRPHRKTVAIFLSISIVAILLNFGLDALLFKPSAPGRCVLPNLQVASFLHEMPRPLWLECVSLVAVSLVFAVPPLFFRFSLRWLDRWWRGPRDRDRRQTNRP